MYTEQTCKKSQQKTNEQAQIQIDKTFANQSILYANVGQCLAVNNLVKEELSNNSSSPSNNKYTFLRYFDPSEAPLITAFKLKKNEINKIAKCRKLLEKEHLKFQQCLRQSDDSSMIDNDKELLVKIEQVEQIQQESPFIIVKSHEVSTSRIAYSWKKKRQMMKFKRQYLPTLIAMKEKNRVYAKRAVKQAEKSAKYSNKFIPPDQIFNSIAFYPSANDQKLQTCIKIQQQLEPLIKSPLQHKKIKKDPKLAKTIRKDTAQKKKAKVEVQTVGDKYTKKIEMSNQFSGDELEWQTNKSKYYSTFFRKILDLQRRRL